MNVVLIAIALLTQTSTRIPANLIGTWALDGFRGAIPLGIRHEGALCGAVLMSRPADTPDGSAGGDQVSSLGTIDGTIMIAVAPAGLVIERKFTGSAGSGAITHIYPLDGSPSVASGDPRVSGKIAVTGTALTVDTTITRGKDAAQTVCTVREVFEVNASGLLQISSTAGAGQRTTSAQTFVRKTIAPRQFLSRS